MTIFTATNILDAYKLARKSRKTKQEVYMFEQNLEKRLLDILDDLKNKKYVHGKYREIILYDTKKRFIFSPHFKDHIVHHLLYKQIYYLLDSKMTHSTFACRKWYGSHRAIKYLQKIIKKEEKSCTYEKLYYLKLDFSKYFFSINHKLLKEKIRKFVDDEEILYLVDIIIDSYKSPSNYDDLLKYKDFYIKQKNKWLPIWWIISQLFANFYLNDLDQFIKHNLKLRFVRYMDDIVIIWTKNDLNLAKQEIFEFVEKEKLILNPKKTSFNLVDDTIKFVWYKIKNWKIFVWKRMILKLLKFNDKLKEFNKLKLNLTKQDTLRIRSMLYSRFWSFKNSSFWENYLKKVFKFNANLISDVYNKE